MASSHQLNFAYTVIFVPDVEKAVVFYERAFGLKRRMMTPAFAQLDTGDVALAFGAEANEKKELPNAFRYRQNRADEPPAGVQISFTSGDVDASFRHAVASGCVAVVEPKRQPWGQTVSRVRDLNGVLVSIVSPFQPPAN